MCLAIPSKIVSIDDAMATVDVFGARKEISLLLLSEPAEIGEYVLVHAGFAIQKMDYDAAQESLRLIRQMAELVAMQDEGIELAGQRDP